MANLRSIRKRIVSIKNTRQITRAMKLVSGAKLKRATDAVIAARPYNHRLKAILENLIVRMDEVSNPLFEVREDVQCVKFVVFSSDRGLCGGFNSSVFRQLELEMAAHAGASIELITVGRKAREYAKRRGYSVVQEITGLATSDFPVVSRELVVGLVKAFEDGQVDKVVLIFNRFKSAMSQYVVGELLLPLTAPEQELAAAEDSLVDYLYEPSQTAILSALLPQLMTAQVMQALLESAASEHGARMTAMDSATRNASEVIDKLTLEYNRARQAAITRELVEIVSGAEAL